jgi:steroid delta-isomerase-like uncharacterized protein
MGTRCDLVVQWWALFEAGRLDEAAQAGQPDVDVMMPGMPRFRGRAELIAMLTVFREAFPDAHHTLIDAVEQGDKVAVEVRVTATHTGTLRTPQGDVPPSGRTVVWESVDFVTFRDGKIASWHAYFDQMAFAAQLGLLPEPAVS